MNPPAHKASFFKTAIQARCPRCGQGDLFAGYLRVVPGCAACGLSFANFATEDGPASLIILPLCMLTAGGSLVLEVMKQPPVWVHVLVWPTFIMLSVGLLLRPVKAGMIALQYRYRERDGTAPAILESPAPIKPFE